jgi:hypothetical protein
MVIIHSSAHSPSSSDLIRGSEAGPDCAIEGAPRIATVFTVTEHLTV